MNDKQIIVLSEAQAFQLQNKINELLEQGGWRVMTCAIELGRYQTFYAVLVRSEALAGIDKAQP